MEIYPAFYRDYEVQLVASLLCYTEENVSAQRGNGVFEKSIRVLRQLDSFELFIKFLNKLAIYQSSIVIALS